MAADRHIHITLPATTPNHLYAALVDGTRTLLTIAGLPTASIGTDGRITAWELNAAHDDGLWVDIRETG